jgi:16S rRNA (cytidine1402-2'-O)-methyltransferase
MSSDRRGELYLVPNTLGESVLDAVIPLAVLDRARSLDYFIAENPKTARAFLKHIGVIRPLQGIQIARLDHNTKEEDIAALLDPVLGGRDAGLLSEAGLPAVADPGANVVRLAHRCGLRVIPLSGPSSLLLALAASGLNGQRFAFHGYLPVAEAELVPALQDLERQSRRLGQTQIFIETPYRNTRTLTTVTRVLDSSTLLCLAADLTTSTEFVVTKPVAAWRKEIPQLKGRPTVFLFLAEG